MGIPALDDGLREMQQVIFTREPKSSSISTTQRGDEEIVLPS